jgi:hypothetical protein
MKLKSIDSTHFWETFDTFGTTKQVRFNQKFEAVKKRFIKLKERLRML